MTDPNTAAAALLIGLAVGLVLGVALMLWATARSSELPAVVETPTPPPENVRDSFRRLATALAQRTYLAGWLHGFGQPKPDRLLIERHLASSVAQAAVSSASNAIATTCARAYADGITELRAALAERTGIEGRMLDQAFEIAIASKRDEITATRRDA